jgi:hypothetical protein
MWKIIPSDAKTPILTRCDLTELEAAKEAKMKGASFLTEEVQGRNNKTDRHR